MKAQPAPDRGTQVAENPTAAPQLQSAAPATDSAPTQPAAAPVAVPNADSIAAAVEARLLERQRQQQRQDSIRAARLAAQQSKTTKTAGSETKVAANTAPAQPAAAPVQQAPAPAPVDVVGRVRIASRTPGAALYINGKLDGPVPTLRWVTIPAGVPVKIEIRADGCAVKFDTVLTLGASEDKPIGYRLPGC